MMFSNVVHLKSLLMVITAASGAVAGGTMANSYFSSKSGSYLLMLDPSSLSVDQGGSGSTTVTVTSLNGFSGAVALSVYYTGQQFNASLSSQSLNVPANGNAKSTLTLIAPSTVGNYTLVVIGQSTSHGKTSYAYSTLTLQVSSSLDFAIVAVPSSITSFAGSTDTGTVTVTSLNGFTGDVSLGVTAPFGFITVTGGESPLTVSPGNPASSTLTIMTSLALTMPGTYNILVTGRSGSHTHATSISITVLDPVPPPNAIESLTLDGYTFGNGTSLTLALRNTGNDSVTLQSYNVRDSAGNSWSLTNWAGPTIAAKDGATTLVLIGSSCPSCIYNGITGSFFQFQHGQTYTVTVFTARNNQFTFTMVY